MSDFYHLAVISGHDVVLFALLGGDLKVNFCFLHGESKCGAGLVIVVGSRYVSFVFFPLLAIGVEMLLIPLRGKKFRIVGVAGDGGFFFGEVTSRPEGARPCVFLLLRALTTKLPMCVHRSRCVLIRDLRHWFLRLHKVCASSFLFGALIVVGECFGGCVQFCDGSPGHLQCGPYGL
jgi:hypothetical protein